MLSIVIADDEAGIIDLCKMLIEYPQATVVGEASNGLELFQKIIELHPNTVITDLSMPGMTGLELIERAQADYPDINFVVMSGYTDFEYVQKALRFGVCDYLLKPLQKSELNAILKKIDKQMEARQCQQQRQKTMQYDLENSREALQIRYLEDVWKSQESRPIPLVGERPVLELEHAKIQCAAFCVDWTLSGLGMDNTALDRQAESLLSHVLDSFSNEMKDIACLAFAVDTVQAGLIIYPEGRVCQTEKTLQALGRNLRAFNNQNVHARLFCAVSELAKGTAEEIHTVCMQAQEALRWRLERKANGVISYQPETMLALQRISPFTQAEALGQAIAFSDEKQVLKCLETDWARLQHPAYGSGYRLMEEQLRCINRALLRLPGADKLWSEPQLKPRWVLSGNSFTTTEFPGKIADGVHQALSEYRSYFVSQEQGVIVQAKAYIAEHFTEEISLNEVAKYVCLSSAYFSTLFKAETGCSFIKYLQRVRIEHAKKMLKSTKVRISDIASSVGYRDLKHFNKIFLAETSVTPSEYRKYYL